jgi:hypothetical protein
VIWLLTRVKWEDNIKVDLVKQDVYVRCLFRSSAVMPPSLAARCCSFHLSSPYTSTTGMDYVDYGRRSGLEVGCMAWVK